MSILQMGHKEKFFEVGDCLIRIDQIDSVNLKEEVIIIAMRNDKHITTTCSDAQVAKEIYDKLVKHITTWKP